MNFWYEKVCAVSVLTSLTSSVRTKSLLDAPEGTVDKAQYTDTPIVHTRIQQLTAPPSVSMMTP